MKDYWLLVRPRVLVLVLVSVGVSAFLTAASPLQLPVLLHAILGTSFLTAGALALNQWWELPSDARMPRTAPRPLPAGRLSPRHGGWFGATLSLLGMGYLAITHRGTWLLIIAAGSWLLYMGAYTPLKSRSTWQTPVGAAAGAMPVLIGAAAADGLQNPLAWNLFAILYSWQLPHAMAVAWIYREQFAAAGLRLATVADPTGRSAAIIACAGAAAAWLLGMLPVRFLPAGWQCAAAAFLLGLGYFASAVWFAVRRDESSARWLLRVSVVHLPMLWAVLVASKAYRL